MSQTLLELTDLCVEIRSGGASALAVDSVSFELNRGQALAIIGESGSGKSMTARAVMGLLPAGVASIPRGSIRFDGRELTTLAPAEWPSVRARRISMIFQDPLRALNPVHSIGRQIAELFVRHRGAGWREGRERAAELLEKVRIPHARRRLDAYPHEFSGGQRQRVMIAIALALDPELVIADEPTTALDVTVQAQILELLREVQAHRSLIVISHDLGVVASIAQAIAVMYAGLVVESGPVREVYTQPAHPYTRALLQSMPSIRGRSGRQRPIPGAPPSLTRRPSGCPFHPRCPFAREICTHQMPPVVAVERHHVSRCHFAGEVIAAGRDDIAARP